MRDHGSTTRILSAATDNWFSRGYLTVCAGLLIWAAADTVFADHADASFAAVWPIVATLPTSLLVVALSAYVVEPLVPGDAAAPVFLCLLAVAAVVNAVLLGLLVRLLGRRSSAPPV